MATEQTDVPLTKDDQLQCATRTYKGVLLFQCEIEEVETMEVLPDDIWVSSYPRSGTTMLQEMTYLVRTLDFQKALTTQLDERFPVIDVIWEHFPYYRGLSALKDLPRPRFVKSHFPYFLLPEQLRNGKAKILYICRDPKDVVLSYYKLLRWYGEIKDDSHVSFEKFFDSFVSGEDLPYGLWFRNVLAFWKRRHDPNVLFLKYEDVTADRCGAIRKIANFLERDLTEDDVTKIAEHCSLERMRSNKMVNQEYQRKYRFLDDTVGGFINKGAVGGWKEQLTDEMAARIDDIVTRELEPHGLTFPA